MLAASHVIMVQPFAEAMLENLHAFIQYLDVGHNTVISCYGTDKTSPLWLSPQGNMANIFAQCKITLHQCMA